MVETRVKGVDEAIVHFRSLPPKTRAAIEPVVRTDATRIRDQARALASGSVLKSKTGAFVNSIVSEVRQSENGVFGLVSSDDPRVDLFEYGGSQAPREILPDVAKALRFAGIAGAGARLQFADAGMVYAAMVHRPVVQYPARPTIHAAFSELESAVERDIEAAAFSNWVDE